MNTIPSDPILTRVLAGDADAFDAWYRREFPAVYRICFGILVDPARADEAARDAMVHLHDRLANYDTTRRFSTWRNAVVMNLCRDRMRRQRVREQIEHDAAESMTTSTIVDPHDAAAANEVVALLEDALCRLSPREREAFVLVVLEQNSPQDAAEALSIGESSVRSLVTLARRRLRQLLGPSLAGSATEPDPKELR
ncbi:MAG: sigma-70 family RNA polymerase sigma factor [Planctomycetes bacterium]|nr:sigma-70 family RNA polymerase sigma factor [Planctomycetota bacterium]MCC7169513.1 sigma-70 family RNA polymerase sigma factor [Planctomycetota bacterium]